MRPKTLILFIVAIGCGLVASIGVSQYMEGARGTAIQLETTKIYVASTEVNIGEKLDDKNIKLEEWPKDRVPEGTISELKDLENKYPRARLYKGEPILASKLSDTIDGNKAQTIPPGYRVTDVKVSADTGGGGLIRPGDRVDIVVFLKKGGEVPQTAARTILRDVNVFASGGETDRVVDKGTGQTREVRTISLLVTPKQAESLMLAKELGIMSLTLRRPNDTTEDNTDGETVTDLLGSEGEDANEKKKDKEDGESGIAKWLNQNAAPVPVPPAPVVPAVPAPAPIAVVEEPAKFVMRIRTPNGDREYRWKDLEGEPEEFDVGAKTPTPLPGPLLVPAVPITQPTPTPIPVPTTAPANEEPAPAPVSLEGAEQNTTDVSTNEQ